jgi:hypothetical protein
LPAGAGLAALHGPLMISGLFGTLISLERAVALGTGWALAAPLLAAAATAMLLAGTPAILPAAFYLAAAAMLAVGSGVIVRAQPAAFTLALLLGALAWVAGNTLWLLGAEIPHLVGWWIAFLLLTIAGERLEMSRLMPPRRGGPVLFAVSVGLVVAGAFLGVADPLGAGVFGVGLLACALWLLRHDIARRNVRASAAPRYFATCMLAGYVWLAVAGLMLLLGARGAFGYDMALHAVLIGFVLSMVFGHALIILPAVTGLSLAYRPLLYLPLVVLHGSLLLRTAGGLLEWELLRRCSGLLAGLAILMFALAMIACGRKRRAAPA